MKVLCTSFHVLLILSTSCFIKFSEDEDRKNNEDWLNTIYKILDVNLISIKKHEMETCQLFYFQVRESPAPPSTFRLQPLHPTTFLGDTINNLWIDRLIIIPIPFCVLRSFVHQFPPTPNHVKPMSNRQTNSEFR